MELYQDLVIPAAKPGIIVRLSNLIVLQVLFIFAALALILFVSDTDPESSALVETRSHALYDAGEVVSEYLNTERPWNLPGDNANYFAQLQYCLDSLTSIGQAALIRVVDSTRFDMMYAYDRASRDSGADEVQTDLSSFVDPMLLRHVAGLKHAGPSHPVVGSRFLVYYKKLELSGAGSPVVLVLAAEHGLSVSSRTGLQYTVLVLFLCAALVSLLTVSLLMRKFKRPLDQIISGLSETAGGKLHHLLELEKDPELGKLARAYNEMAHRLWEDRFQLDSYFGKLTKANTELRESQSFLSALIECSPLSVVVADPEGRIILFNRVAAEEFGYTPGEIVGRPFVELLAENGDCFSVPVNPGERREFEVTGQRRNGGLFPVQVVSSEIRAEDDRLVARLYICRDITDNRDFQEMMIRLDRYYTKGEMTGDIAHEINNYLAVLMGNVELMPLMLKKGDSEKINRKLELMKTTLEKIARFSDGLLDSSSDAIRLEPISINQVVENVIAFLKPQNKFDTVDVVKELSTDIPVTYADAAQVQQLLVNLVYNAAEALAEKQGDRTIRVSTSLVDSGGKETVAVTVQDNGPGVVRDKEPLLFKTRFTTKRRGHGIGLMTCHRIVDNHGGVISYRFSDGAVFSVELPVKTAAPKAVPCTESVAQPH